MQLLPLTDIELAILSHTAIRVLIAKGILSKDDLMADLARQGVDESTAFRLFAVLEQTPDQ